MFQDIIKTKLWSLQDIIKSEPIETVTRVHRILLKKNPIETVEFKLTLLVKSTRIDYFPGYY